MLTLGKEKAVYSILLPEVRDALLDINLSALYVHTADKEHLDQFRWDLTGKFKWWVKDIVDLSEFKHAYPINGVTQALEQWLLDHPGHIQHMPGEYGWMQIQRPSLTNNIVGESAYFSNPFSADGNFHDDYKNTDLPTLLDCAFVGSTEKHKIELTPNIKAIAFSLSKGFSTNLFRTGILFSREPIPSLEVWLGFNYYNYPAMHVMKRIIDEFPVDYLSSKLRSTQLDICDNYNLTPSDCVFLATSKDEQYSIYKRGDGTNRICLSREMVKRGLGSFSLSGSM